MRKVLQVVVVLVAVVTMASVANADTTTNIVQNGNFATTATFNGGGWATLYAGSNALPDWTIGGNSIDVVNGAGNLWQAAPSGGNSIDMSGDNAGLTSQVLNTVPVGSLWTISFYLSGSWGSTADKTLQVTFGSQSWTYVVPGGTTSAQNMNWQLITISNILIPTTPTTLTFTSLTGGPFGPVIAGISVVDPLPEDAPAVPEPASMVLLGTGLVGIAGLRKMKRR